MLKCILFCVFTVSISFYHQAQITDLDVRYDTDKSELTREYKDEIRNILSVKENQKLVKITLVGHTDSDASDEYNMRLSQARVEGVKAYLLEEGISESIIVSSFEGESSPKAPNDTPEGKQENRRVHMVVETRQRARAIIDGAPEPIVDCAKDTLIPLPSGSMYRINICDYLNNPGCVQINEIFTAQDLADEDITTMSEHGEQLVSGGMIRYSVCEGVSVDVFVPVPNEGCVEANMQRWDADNKGNWVRASLNKLPVRSINNQQYYGLSISGSGLVNCDYIPTPAPPPPKTRFKRKWRSGLTLKSVTIYCNCPLSGVKTESKKGKGKKVIVDRTCCPDALIKVEATDKKGNPLSFETRRLSELEGNTFMGDCKTDIRKEWWFIRTWNKEMHRKYKLHKDDFE